MSEEMQLPLALQEAIRATEYAHNEVREYLSSNKHPRAEEAHAIIDKVLQEHGMQSPLGHIVASGVKSFEPHEVGGGDLISGVPIVVDIYPQSTASGYWGDLTRTYCIGEAPKELRRMYQTVLEALQKAEQYLTPGMTGGELHQIVLEFFNESGYSTGGAGTEFKLGYGFVHALGHGVGTEIHQAPRIGLGSTDILKEGDIVTLEPGLYYPEIGGVRIEDMYRVTKNGVERLSSLPYELEL